MSWLASLPHQIPFRAASAARRIDEKTIEGVFLCTVNDELPAELMLVEAMAQFAGGLALDSQGFLFGIDRCEVTRAIEPGDEVRITVTLEASLAGMHRFNAAGAVGGVEVCRGRFYLASPEALMERSSSEFLGDPRRSSEGNAPSNRGTPRNSEDLD